MDLEELWYEDVDWIHVIRHLHVKVTEKLFFIQIQVCYELVTWLNTNLYYKNIFFIDNF